MDIDKLIAKVKDLRTPLAELARISGVSVRTLMQIRHEDANPTAKTMRKIAAGMRKIGV